MKYSVPTQIINEVTNIRIVGDDAYQLVICAIYWCRRHDIHVIAGVVTLRDFREIGTVRIGVYAYDSRSKSH